MNGITVEELRRIEIKMLPSLNGRRMEESPKIALTRDEQLTYADYLQSIGHHQGAEFFRK